MTFTRPGRLYRALPFAIGRPLFAFFSPDTQLYDDAISSVVITRGADSRGGGLAPSIMEITVPGTMSPAINGSLVRFFMREVPAERLGAIVGKTGAQISSRYQGRAGAVAMDDQGDRYTTTLAASSYTQQMLSSPRTSRPLAGQTIARVLNDAFGTLDGSVIAGITFGTYGTYDRLAVSEDSPIRFRDVISTYAEDLGILIRETRAGETQAFTSTYRRDLALGSQLTSMPHLTRAQVLTPAKWSQRNELPGLRINYSITNADGAVSVRTAEITTNLGMLEAVDVDWSHIRGDDTLQTFLEAYGRVQERSARHFRLESVTIDLLRLIDSDSEYHRQQAGNLLMLEAGDPIYLSGDWPAQVQGVHFAQQIKETISGDEWTLELSLYPIAQVLGVTSPPVPARVWDSLRYPWDTESRTWNLTTA